jgi:hypothetical protein
MSLIHLNNGTLGSRGHCVSVEQKISELFTTLSRKPGHLNLLNVRRSGRSSGNEVYERVFKVQKDKLLAALYWLVKHIVLYHKYVVVIDPSNLDWMGDENECVLLISCTIQTDQDDSPEDDDMGPSAGHILMEKLDQMEGLDLEVNRTMSNIDCAPPTEEYARLLEDIRSSKAGKEKGTTINWPAFCESPIYEYGEKRVFCLLFPWFYPGGNGDFNKIREVDIGFKDWVRQQLFMDGSRFAKEKTWCLYALNYAKRRRNMKQGQWYVNNLLYTEDITCMDSLKVNNLLYTEEITCIDSLKEKLKNNDTKFIEKLQYFAECVPGLDSYWRNKRVELIYWIDYHVEQGNGAPYLFVTLSCAGYHWQDIEKLLNARRKITGDPPISLKTVT